MRNVSQMPGELTAGALPRGLHGRQLQAYHESCRAHLPFGAQSFEEAELLGPSHQVMDLIELDPPAEIGKRSLGLSAALRSAGGPDLGGNDRTIPSALERIVPDDSHVAELRAR